MTEDRPAWDEDRARGLIGKIVLLGLTFATADGEVYILPPDLRPFSEAAPGSYSLRSTGETIVDPDFTSTWEIRSPREEDDTSDRREARLREAERFGFPPR